MILLRTYTGQQHLSLILARALPSEKNAWLLFCYVLSVVAADSILLQGHEGCGEIVQVGSAVSDFQVGEMVTVLSVPGCGASSCPECSNDLGQICETGEHYGIGHDGAFAPYMAIKARAAVKLPAGVSVAHGAVGTDAVMTAYHAVVGRAQVSKNDTVLLFGLGGLGFNALQILRHIGANVIVVDKRQQVLDEAVSFGVSKDNVVPIDTSNIPEWIAAKGIKVDKVIDFVGHPDTFKAGIDAGKKLLCRGAC